MIRYFHHIHHTYFRNIVFLLRVESWEGRKVLLDFPQEAEPSVQV